MFSYKQNGILHMLDRNRRIKLSPQRFQDDHEQMFDIVVTCEERVYDQVIEGRYQQQQQQQQQQRQQQQQ